MFYFIFFSFLCSNISVTLFAKTKISPSNFTQPPIIDRPITDLCVNDNNNNYVHIYSELFTSLHWHISLLFPQPIIVSVTLLLVLRPTLNLCVSLIMVIILKTNSSDWTLSTVCITYHHLLCLVCLHSVLGQ